MRVWLMAAILLAGCSAPPVVQEAPPPQDDGITAVAFRVEPVVTDVGREGPLAWGGCSTTPLPCSTAPDQFGANEWLIEASHDEVVFWRVNATLTWQEESPRLMRLELQAIDHSGCTPEEDPCGNVRVVLTAIGKSPVHVAGEFFPKGHETTMRLVASPRPYNPYTSEIAQQASLSGLLLSYHPVSGPIAVNVTAG